MRNLHNIQDVTKKKGIMARTVNLFNLNLKELFYHCHMQTAMKTFVMQSVYLIVNGLYSA